jgi:AcrR family transcriptional regulator
MPEDLWTQARIARPLEEATRDRLLAATERLVQQIGVGKTSMADVAREAGVARGTLYRYFESREILFDALTRRTTDQFFGGASAAMDERATLSEQVGVFSEMMIEAIHPGSRDTQSMLVRLLARESAQALRRTARFLRPYIEAARERGEVRADLDISDASEWLARILLSFTIFQAGISYEADDPRSVSSFVQRYAISGLAAR